MDNMILGLLLLCNRTVYELRERIDKGLNLMYSSSMGSIQAAIKKLLKSRYIDYEEIVAQGKYKKVYHITESGKQAFLAWVNAPMEEQGIKCPGLVKLYFMGFCDQKNREASLESYLLLLKEQQRALTIICEEAKQIAVTQENQEILNYQMASACYGKAFYQFQIDWFEKLLSKVRNKEL